MEPREYTIGLPVNVYVYDDGRVVYEVDTAEATDIDEDEAAIEEYGEDQVLADRAVIGAEHDARFKAFYALPEGERGHFPAPAYRTGE